MKPNIKSTIRRPGWNTVYWFQWKVIFVTCLFLIEVLYIILYLYCGITIFAFLSVDYCKMWLYTKRWYEESVYLMIHTRTWCDYLPVIVFRQTWWELLSCASLRKRKHCVYGKWKFKVDVTICINPDVVHCQISVILDLWFLNSKHWRKTKLNSFVFRFLCSYRNYELAFDISIYDKRPHIYR